MKAADVDDANARLMTEGGRCVEGRNEGSVETRSGRGLGGSKEQDNGTVEIYRRKLLRCCEEKED